MLTGWDLTEFLMTASREEREKLIDEMTESEAKEFAKSMLRAICRLRDSQAAEK